MAEALLSEAQGLRKQLTQWRRHFHKHPELGFQELGTSEYVRERLREMGLRPFPPFFGTDVVAELSAAGAAKTVALRADMDALPVQELSDHVYRSTNDGVAHLCGHDAHMAMLLGAAALLVRRKDELQVNVRLLFQPAEERPPGGAAKFVESGVLDGVEEIFGLHVDSRLPVGVLSTCAGPIMAAADGFEARVKGRGGHAASPHLSLDPIPVAAEAILALQSIASRFTNPTEPVVLSVCKVHAGTAFNVTPEEATIAGTVRTVTRKHRRQVPRLMRRTLTGIARSAGMTAELRYDFYYPPTVNDPKSTEYVVETIRKLTGRSRAFREARVRMGAEDFSCYLEKVPGAFVFLGSRGKHRQTRHNHHSPYFDVDEKALPLGAALLAALALGRR